MPISRVWRDGLCVIVAAFGLLAAVRGISYLLRLRKRRHGSATCVAFFPDPCTPCMAYLRTLCTHHPMLWPDNCGRRNCSHDHNLQYPFGRLLHSLAYAQSTIDVCVFVFTCSEIAETLAMLCRYRNIRVRVIVDGSQRNIVGSQLDTLDRVGIEIRHNPPSTYLMHNKFVIIDGLLVISGSLNWTKTAIVGNYENIIITRKKSVVNCFENKFEYLWAQFAGFTYSN